MDIDFVSNLNPVYLCFLRQFQSPSPLSSGSSKTSTLMAFHPQTSTRFPRMFCIGIWAAHHIALSTSVEAESKSHTAAGAIRCPSRA